jgi:pimeloyl-ACP methyl ester carboxylesterase
MSAMAEAEFKGVPVHHETWGTGLPLVALHGGGSSGAQWQRLAAVLQDGNRVIAPDLIGFGKTGAWPEPGGLTHDLQADLVAVLIEQNGSGAVDVVGHSYGGATAVRLALRRPELVRSLVLVEPVIMSLLREANDPLFGEYRDMAEDFVRHARAGRENDAWALFLDYRNGPGTWVGTPEKAKTRFLGQTAQTVEGFLSNLSNPTTLDDCRRISAPTTIVCGAETTAPDRRVTELLRDAVPGCRHVTIPGAGHMSPLTHPEDLARIVLDHLGWDGARTPTAT